MIRMFNSQNLHLSVPDGNCQLLRKTKKIQSSGNLVWPASRNDSNVQLAETTSQRLFIANLLLALEKKTCQEKWSECAIRRTCISAFIHRQLPNKVFCTEVFDIHFRKKAQIPAQDSFLVANGIALAMLCHKTCIYQHYKSCWIYICQEPQGPFFSANSIQLAMFVSIPASLWASVKLGDLADGSNVKQFKIVQATQDCYEYAIKLNFSLCYKNKSLLMSLLSSQATPTPKNGCKTMKNLRK